MVLDLMSSWVSHLPDEVRYGRVIGHGMNAQEVRNAWPVCDSIASLRYCGPHVPLWSSKRGELLQNCVTRLVLSRAHLQSVRGLATAA